MKTIKMVYATLSLGLVMPATKAAAQPAWETAPVTSEKCYGVVKAGQNDCESLDYTGSCRGHSCSGFARTDSSDKEFVLVPTGLCAKLTGGEVK